MSINKQKDTYMDDSNTVKVLKQILGELKALRESVEAQQKRLSDREKEASEVAALFTGQRKETR